MLNNIYSECNFQHEGGSQPVYTRAGVMKKKKKLDAQGCG